MPPTAAVDAFAQFVDLIDGQRRVLVEVLGDGSLFVDRKSCWKY